MNAEDYKTQHFPPRPNREGAKENADAYNTRIYWFKNNFPTYQTVADAFGFKLSRVQGYADKYNWKLIRANYEEMIEKEEAKQYRKDAKKMEKKQNTANELIFNRNIKRMEHLLFILDELPNNPAPTKLDSKEEEKARRELEKIEDKIIKLQPNIRTSYHLPNTYNDKQVNENKTKLDGAVLLEHKPVKSFNEEMKEYEDFFKKIESEAEGNNNQDSMQE